MNAFREIGVMADRINLPRKIVVSNHTVDSLLSDHPWCKKKWFGFFGC